MAPKGTKVGLMIIVLIVTIFCEGSTAQSGCTRVLISLSPCINYVTGSSSTPSSSCCSQLARVVQSQPQCLCSVLNGGGGASSLGVTVNQTLALSLPGSCDVKTPPASNCNNAAKVPANYAPVSSQITSPPAVDISSDKTPETHDPTKSTEPISFQSGTGSRTDHSMLISDGRTIKASLRFNFLALFFVISSSTALAATIGYDFQF